MSPLMRHSTTLLTFVCLSAIALAGCGSDTTPTNPTDTTPPVAVTETFAGTLTINGLQSHAFAVTRAGTVSAVLKVLSDPAVTIGVSLGTWNGAACTIVIANPAATLNTSVVGTAQNSGQFCVLLNDIGRLTAAVDYAVDVSHY